MIATTPVAPKDVEMRGDESEEKKKLRYLTNGLDPAKTVDEESAPVKSKSVNNVCTL